MNKLLSIALASALFATTGFASVVVQTLDISENGSVKIIGDTTANIGTNAGTIQINAGKTLTDDALVNSGTIKIGVSTATEGEGDAATTTYTYGHIANATSGTAYTITQNGWDATANNNKGAATGLISFVNGEGASADVPVNCTLALDESQTWTPALTDIFGSKFKITSTEPAVEADEDNGIEAHAAIVYQLSEDGLRSDKATSGTMADIKVQTVGHIEKFFGRLNVTGLDFTVTDQYEFERSLMGIDDENGGFEAQNITEAKTGNLPQDVEFKAKITGNGGLTFTSENVEGAPFKITLSSDMSEYAGKLTTDGDLEIKTAASLPGGDMDIAGALIINSTGAEADGGVLTLKGTAEKKHTIEAGSITLTKSFTVGEYGELILGSEED